VYFLLLPIVVSKLQPGGKRERKREWWSIGNTVKHNICESRGHKDVY
jgi:hypothetical protein